MLEAFDVCKHDVNISVSWIKESNFKALKVMKTDFIVFEEFEGEIFDDLKTTKSARVVGPWVVSVCLTDGKPIPNFDWPIYNVAMYDCIVSCSHLPKNIKMEIRVKVELMGGCYVDSLVEKTTHLITGSAKSEKYLIAAEAGLKLMCPSWVEDVWTVSQDTSVHADDEEFKKHTCLAFQNLTISSTGITNAIEKQTIEKLVKGNGGVFTGKLNLSSTDILICSGDVSNSEKYKAARQCNHIKCVNASWVTDSVAKGYALPHNMYQVQKSTSTPIKMGRPFVDPEFSILSAIGGPNSSQRSSVEETIATDSPMEPVKVGVNKRKAKDYLVELIENLDIRQAKKAGQYLDGCSVYLTGFDPEHTEKLNKIINMSGATRYDTFSDRVTHVIVGDPKNHEVTIVRNKNTSAVLISIQWLIDSMEQGLPVREEKYLVVSSVSDSSQLGSPLSKKGLSLLRSNKTVTEKEIEQNLNNVEDQMDHIHSRQNVAAPNISDTLGRLLEGVDNSNFTAHMRKMNQPAEAVPQPSQSTQSSMSVTQDAETEMSRIFECMKFLVVGFDEEEYQNLKESITDLGGEIVPKTYKGIPDYAVVPIFNHNELHHTASEVVNDLFISDCIREEEVVLNISYHHRPFDLPDTKPIENCVVTISGYSGTERAFLKNLIEGLGGIAQEQFSRVRQERKNLIPSTHLLSPEATGKKYDAALKWGLPVVSKEWLLECAKTGKQVYEGDYLLGDSKAPERKEDHVSTPNNKPGPSRLSKVLTPVNQATPYHSRFLNSAEKFSQVTPVNKIMKQFRENNPGTSHIARGTSQIARDSKEYIPEKWDFVKTPETPLGAFLTPNPSPGLRKQWEHWLQKFPDKPSPESNKSTPLSEMKRRLREKVEKIGGQQLDFNRMEDTDRVQERVQTTTGANVNLESSTSDAEKTPENQQLASRLQQLEDMLSASGCGKRQSRNFQSTIPVPAGTAEFKDSQPCTVGWDFTSQEPLQYGQRIFSLSGIGDDSERARMVQQLELLGGTVSSLLNYDPSCTHLLCPKPARNEKSLSCMAAGKWTLHISYLEKSLEAGRFLDEEEFEFGNPKSVGKFPTPHDKETDLRMQRMHWWRKEIARRGYGAFNDMRAIVVANKKEPIVRVIEAGGGVVINMKPPFEDTIHATHCLLEQKSVENFSDYIPLAKQGIYLVNTVYISDYLHQPHRDIRDCILPYFSKYYGRS